VCLQATKALSFEASKLRRPLDASFIDPCVRGGPLVNFPASGALRGERKVQCTENDLIRSDAGRNWFSEDWARDHDVGHDLLRDRK